MTQPNISISADGQIQLSFVDRYDGDVLRAAMDDFLPLLLAKLETKKAMLALEHVVPNNRFKAVAALDGVGKYHLAQASAIFAGIADIATGRAVASEFGFPEFDDDAEEGLFD